MTLLSTFEVLIPCQDLLFILQFVFGALVWSLIASSLVPFPQTQAWVMFVSVSCFIGTTVLLFLYMCGANCKRVLDAAYHCTAALFYFSASVLETWATFSMDDGFSYEHYLENIFATVFSYVATLLYMVHAVLSLVIWKKSAEETQWKTLMVISLRPPYSLTGRTENVLDRGKK
ncbi:myelin and lymphocyte protein-like [Equus quagga]|uniref:myelin and lymphocyte protein-like n=1 Tax=Equus quagga TaxID=89248 RepID=UPI001EE1B89C|nr:myelin and lymphocyte protein-like [Equus quagga]